MPTTITTPESTAMMPVMTRTMTMFNAQDLDVLEPNLRPPFPPGTNVFTKRISGHVYDQNGAPVVGATVVLYRQKDDYQVTTTTSGTQGQYVFPRRVTDSNEYYTVAYSLVNNAIQIHGASERGLVPYAQ